MKSPRLNVREGHTAHKDEVEAIADLCEQVDQPGASLALFFCSPNYDMSRLASAVEEAFDYPVVGCTAHGALGAKGFLSGGISAMSLSGPIQAHTFEIELNKCEEQAAIIGEEVTKLLASTSFKSAFGLLLVDGLSLAEERLAAALYQHTARLPIIGGSAADELDFNETFVYSNGTLKSGRATFSLVLTDVEVATFKFEHFVPTDRIAVITASDPSQRVIKEINGEPAADAYSSLVGIPLEDIDDRVFSMNPLILELDGDQYVRSLARINPDRSITLFCAIEDGVVLTIGRTVDPSQAAEEAFHRVRETIGTPSVVIGCDCILRRLEFDNTNLLDEIGKIMSMNRVVGFSTYGEQYNAIHVNQTFTGIALGGG